MAGMETLAPRGMNYIDVLNTTIAIIRAAMGRELLLVKSGFAAIILEAMSI